MYSGMSSSNTVFIEKMKGACLEVSQILKAMAHPHRLMILGHLFQGPKSVNELVKLCEASQSQVSQFLARMKSEGLVRSEKDGPYNVYSVADRRLLRLMRTIHASYCE